MKIILKCFIRVILVLSVFPIYIFITALFAHKVPKTDFIGKLNQIENSYDFTCPRGSRFSFNLRASSEEDFKGCKGVVKIIQNNHLIKEFSFDSKESPPSGASDDGIPPASRNITWKGLRYSERVVDLDDFLTPGKPYQIKIIFEKPPSGKIELWSHFLTSAFWMSRSKKSTTN